MLQTLAYDTVWLYALSVVVMVTMITTLMSCLCCRKQEMKNDLLGLEGMVKLTNPEDTLTSQATSGPNGAAPSDLRSSTGGLGSDTESTSKRASNAPHRSLPDIPVAEPAGDNNSELYATVGDKVQDLPQGRSPTASLKKQASVSQHSSISQADDISSPYARVRSPPHAYDKLRRMEHPYAQVVQPGTSGTATTGTRSDDELLSPISRRESAQNLEDRDAAAVDIPAASAIAGRVSASQDLPYMTPPIVQPAAQHFSGDSQDSSKGYTSISVREPLANLLPQNQTQATAQRRQILGDSHYATVSDDSDEMYAAIDDPNNQVDLYTSGSETYAQIQPPNAVTVSVEINTGASSRPPVTNAKDGDVVDTAQQPPATASTSGIGNASNTSNNSTTIAATSNSGTSNSNSTSNNNPNNRLSIQSVEDGTTHIPPVDSLRAQSFVHSRQASSSSCTSSVGNLGSPKPEKRQANSPLPPTPKTLKHQANNFFSNSNQSVLSSNPSTTVPSGRNSAASVIEYGGGGGGGTATGATKADDGTTMANGSAIKPKKSPSKDLEGMYAKVMKKNKLSKLPSQNSSPVPLRKDGTADDGQPHPFLSDSDMSQFNGSGSLHGSPGKKATPYDNKYETIDKNRPTRNSSYDSKDPGYETIPGDAAKRSEASEMRKSADYAQIQKMNRPPTALGGTTVTGTATTPVTTADSEPGYESLPDPRGHDDSGSHDPGYETLNRNRAESDSDPNYEILRPATTVAVSELSRNNDGYSSIRDKRSGGTAKNRLDFGKDEDNDSTPGYSSIREKEDYDPGYSVISEKKKPPVGHDYASITEDAKKKRLNVNVNNNLEPEDESDIYSSIPATMLGPSAGGTGALAVGTGATTAGNNNYSTIPERTLTSSPGYSSISETRTTPSSTDGDGSTSSPDNLIGYAKHQNNTNTNNSISRISSNYESLTGSESDPNYESVKYLNVRENPYERLHNERSIRDSTGTPGIISSNDSLTKSGTVDSITDSDTATATPTLAATAPGGTSDGDTPAVADYFQV